MIKALFNDKTALELRKTSDGGLTGEVNGEVYKWDVSEISPNSWSVIDENGNSFSLSLDLPGSTLDNRSSFSLFLRSS